MTILTFLFLLDNSPVHAPTRAIGSVGVFGIAVCKLVRRCGETAGDDDTA